MKFRIAMWASAGFLVAGFWALFAVATFPSTSQRMRDILTLISLTCPISIAGIHYPIGLYEVLAANTITYALVGLIVETLRHRLHHARRFRITHYQSSLTSILPRRAFVKERLDLLLKGVFVHHTCVRLGNPAVAVN
jgi:hypothetical protein